MELLNMLDNFVASAPWGWIIGLSLGWLILGCVSLKWTIMGLIGYHNDPKGTWMLLAFIIFWPVPFGYVMWMYFVGWVSGLFESKPKVNKDQYPHGYRFNQYELIGVGINLGSIDPISVDASYYGLSTGAGECSGEILKVYAEIEKDHFYYKGFTPDTDHRVFYREIGTDKIHHQTKSDFAKRMMPMA